jgi:hypothetical protein
MVKSKLPLSIKFNPAEIKKDEQITVHPFSTKKLS